MKRLAAKFDTTQADIIERALEAFERPGWTRPHVDEPLSDPRAPAEVPPGGKARDPLQQVLQEARAHFEQHYPQLAESHAVLRRNLHLLDGAITGRWELPFEE